MTRLEISAPSDPKWIAWRSVCDPAGQTMRDGWIAQIEDGEFRPDVLKPQTSTEKNLYSEGKPFFRRMFRGKCAYCEQLIAGHPGALDHFRPKNAVYKLAKDQNGEYTGKVQLVRVETQQRIEPHPGYFWLGNDWENLVLSCDYCNSRRSHEDGISGKGAIFPVQDDDYSVDPRQSDVGLLLNPTRDDISRHLQLDPFTFFVEPRGKSERGIVAILVHGLNRGELVMGRKATFYSVIGQYKRWFTAWDEPHPRRLEVQQECVEAIDAHLRGDHAHTMAAVLAVQTVGWRPA